MTDTATARLETRSPYDKLDRVAEARGCLTRVMIGLSNSKNIKTEIKEAVKISVERLFVLVKEAESDRKKGSGVQGGEKLPQPVSTQHPPSEQKELRDILKEHGELLADSNGKIKQLQDQLTLHRETMEKMTYAGVVAGGTQKTNSPKRTLHTVMITSTDETDTGDQVLEKIRKTVNARDEEIKVDKIRKVKDRKIIVGCKDGKEMDRVKDKIREQEGLTIEDIKAKDPLVILYGVLQSNSDEDIMKSIKNQNRHLFQGLGNDEYRIEMLYRRRARNPLTVHVVLRVSPQVWNRLTEAGAVHVDMQRVRVADQSPLVQCSQCLGYGHGRRFCQEQEVACGHCGGNHLRAQCTKWQDAEEPSCVNCQRAKAIKTSHSVYSQECPVRRKWDTLARSRVAYC